MKHSLLKQFESRIGQIALLIDPEKTKTEAQLIPLLQKAVFAKIDYLFVGGSTVSKKEMEQTIQLIKAHCTIPLVIFPGSSHQLSDDADGLLFLNLISGRNPDYLIGHHVACAEEVLAMNLEVIPTSYILIDGGKMTSVAYISQTTPIPSENMGIALKTAIAGYLMGQKITYFDAGSGAEKSVPISFIQATRDKIPTPIIIGGGIKSIEQIQEYTIAKANVIVIGNKIESDTDFLLDIANYQNTQSESLTD